MIILVVAATEMEIKEFLLRGLNQVNAEIKIEILITGIGCPSAIYHLTKQVLEKKYDLVIQAGIAGSFINKYANGSVLLVKKEIFADIGIQEKNNYLSIFETGLTDGNIIPYENGWLINENPLLKLINIPKVTGITINTISDSKKHLKMYKNKYDAEVESMEGAALHFVCLQLNQPFLQLRSISNKVGERDKENWDMKNAIKNLNKELLGIVNLLSNN